MTRDPETPAERLILSNQALIMAAISVLVQSTSAEMGDLLLGQAERTRDVVELAETTGAGA